MILKVRPHKHKLLRTELNKLAKGTKKNPAKYTQARVDEVYNFITDEYSFRKSLDNKQRYTMRLQIETDKGLADTIKAVQDKKMKRGVKPKFDWKGIVDRMEDYIEDTDYPILQEFLYINNISTSNYYQQLGDEDEIGDTLTELHERLHQKRAYVIETQGMKGKFNSRMAREAMFQEDMPWDDTLANRNKNATAEGVGEGLMDFMNRKATPDSKK